MKLRLNRSRPASRGTFRVATKTQEVTVDIDPRPIVKTVGEAAKEALAAGIKAVSTLAASGEHRRWNRTGHLASSLRVEMVGNSAHVRPSDDRLNFDGALKQLAEDVRAAREPHTEPRVKEAVRIATANMVSAQKGPPR